VGKKEIFLEKRDPTCDPMNKKGEYISRMRENSLGGGRPRKKETAGGEDLGMERLRTGHGPLAAPLRGGGGGGEKVAKISQTKWTDFVESREKQGLREKSPSTSTRGDQNCKKKPKEVSNGGEARGKNGKPNSPRAAIAISPRKDRSGRREKPPKQEERQKTRTAPGLAKITGGGGEI